MTDFTKFLIKIICGLEYFTYSRMFDELLQLIRVFGQEGTTTIYTRKVSYNPAYKENCNIFFQTLKEFQRMKNSGLPYDAFFGVMLCLPVLNRKIINPDIADFDLIQLAHTRCCSYLLYKIRD